jgi:hypothetical protein
LFPDKEEIKKDISLALWLFQHLLLEWKNDGFKETKRGFEVLLATLNKVCANHKFVVNFVPFTRKLFKPI